MARRYTRRRAGARGCSSGIGINLGRRDRRRTTTSLATASTSPARLEMLAEPAVSADDRAPSATRSASVLEDIEFPRISATQAVKNIARPIRVYFGSGLSRQPKPGRRTRGRAVATAASKAVDRGAAARQHERRSRAGVFRGRPHRGHHYGAVTLPRPARDLPQLDLCVQGQGGEGAGRRARTRRRLRPARAACGRRAVASASPCS